MLKNIAEESYKACLAQDVNSLKQIQYIDYNINKFTNYCERLLITSNNLEFKYISYYYHIFKMLEQIGDEYKYIIEDLSRKKIKISEDFKINYKKTNQILEKFCSIFSKHDIKECIELVNEIRSNKNSILKSIIIKDSNLLQYHLLTINRILETLVGDLFTIKN